MNLADLLRWWYRRWRARRYVWAADVQYRRAATPRARDARDRAAAYLRRVEVTRP